MPLNERRGCSLTCCQHYLDKGCSTVRDSFGPTAPRSQETGTINDIPALLAAVNPAWFLYARVVDLHCRNFWVLVQLTCHIIWCCAHIQDLQDACHLQKEASVEWGRGKVLCAPAKWKRRVGVVHVSCLSVASCVSCTTERFLLGDCPITTGNRNSLSFIGLSASLHQPGCQILQSRFLKVGTLGGGF
jgi:hypothetical protein